MEKQMMFGFGQMKWGIVAPILLRQGMLNLSADKVTDYTPINQNATAFSYDETVPVLIPRPGSPFGLVVSLRQGTASYEAANPGDCNAGFCSPGDHDIRFALSDVICCRVEAVVCSCTSCGNGVCWPHQTSFYG
nr:hypothetical protein Itr_chr06CG07880 [Ipomoea trifida]